MSSKNLAKLCSELPYSNSDTLNDEIFESTLNILQHLWLEYDYFGVLGELSGFWLPSKAVIFFNRYLSILSTTSHSREEDMPLSRVESKLTIATSYHRCYHGGVERVQAQLMTLWVEMGYRVICFSEEPESEFDYPYPSSVKRIIIPSDDNMIERLRSIQTNCVEEHVNLYIEHDWTNPVVLWECVLLKMLNIPFVVHNHNTFEESFWRNKELLYQPEIFKLCDLILALSETNARFFQLCGCHSYLVQNPVPEDLTCNTVASLDSKHILMVGRLHSQKRPMDSLRIFKLVHDRIPDVVLDIVGGDDGNYYVPKIKAFIAENNLEGHIILHGMKNAAEVADFYKRASCVISTSEMEGYSMVFLETKAYGLPFVMYELPYLTLVKDGKGILTARQGDLDTMADHLVKLLTNDSFRHRLGKEARESFDFFNSYDQVTAWHHIISLATCGKLDEEDPAYFDPADVGYADRLIEPMLLNAMKKGYDNIFQSSIDYLVGQKVLKYPRKIKALWHKTKSCIWWFVHRGLHKS